MTKRFTILMLLMAIFMPWTAKAQETKMIQAAPDRGGNRGTITVYKRVSSLTSGRNYLIVSSATANSDALALSQASSTASTITASNVHINSGISATGNAAYIANLTDPTAVWTATSGWTFSHSKNGSEYYIYTSSTYSSAGSLSANTTAINWDWSNNQLSYTATLLGILTSTYYITPSSTGFSIGSSAANVYLYEETSVTGYNVTASISPAGVGRVTGVGQYPEGATCTLTASTNNSEYTFINWTVNGIEVSTSPTFNFTVSEDFDVVANFESTASCPSPTNVTVTNETSHGATIAWDGTSDSYTVMVSEAEQGSTYSYDFEDGTSQGWTTFQGNTTSPHSWMHNTQYSAYDSNQELIVPECHNSSSGMMLSESYISAATAGGTPYGAVTPDNYLVSPQIRLGGSITFYAASRMSNYPAEKFSVMVSESGNTSANDFTHTELTVTLSDNSWHEYTVDLSAYSGMGYVAIRHYDCNDQHLLYIDDITIENGSGSASTWMTYEAEASPFVLYDAEHISTETTYNVQVIGICGDEESNSSTTTSFTTTITCPAPTDLAVVENSITGHGATVTWNGTSESYNVYLGIDTAPTLPNVDFSNGIPSNWNNDATYPWTVVDGHIQSGNAGVASSTSTISVTGTFPANGTVEFDAECLGEGTSTYYDHCDFSIDGTRQLYAGANISGWNHYTYDVTAGQHTFTWSYTKDSSVDPTGDYFAIDNVMMIFPHNIVWNDPISVENTEYTFSGLTSETTYVVKVQSDCGDEGISAESDPVYFTTNVTCPAPTDLNVANITGRVATINWTGSSDSYIVMIGAENLVSNVDFETGDFSQDEFTTTTDYPWTVVENTHSGAYCAKSGNGGNASTTSDMILEVTLATEMTLSFSAIVSSESGWDYGRFLIDGTQQFETSGTSNSWAEYSYPLTAGSHTLIWRYYKDGSGDYGDDCFYVDNILIKGNATSWTEYSTSETTYTFNNLTSSTSYQVKVKGDCGEEGMSAESEPVTFITDVTCPAPTGLIATNVTSNSAVLNWTGNAESYNVSYYKTFFFDSFEEDLSQWTIYKEGDDDSWEWNIENPNDNSSDLNAHSGNYAVVAYSAEEVHADSWLVSPQILFPNQTTLKFWIMRSTYDDAPDEYEVLLSTTGDAISDFTTVLKEKAAANSTWTEVSIDLSEYDGQQGYIAIRHDFIGGFFIMVDDFGIYGWSEEITTTDNNLLIEDLLPETEYLWQVQANCGDEDGLSQWASSTFTTLSPCPVPFDLNVTEETAYGATISWTGFNDSYIVMVSEEEQSTSHFYDFEDGWQGWTILKGTNGDSPNNWHHNTTHVSYDGSTGNLQDWSSYGHNSSSGFMISESYISATSSGGTAYGAVTPDNYLVSPQVRLGGSISFYAGARNTSYCAEKFSVMVSTTDNTNTASFTTVETWILSLSEAGYNSTPYTVDLSAYAGQTGYIAIRHWDCYDQWVLCIDDITIVEGSSSSWTTYEAEASPFVLYDDSNILPETTYQVKVKGICGDEETEYSETVTFTTLNENTKIFVIEGDWSDGDNWVPAGVPSIDDDVILRAEATVFDVAEANNIFIDGAGSLTIEDGGQLKTNADVEATMKKFIIGYGTDYVETNDGYYLMALPTAAPVAAADAGLMTEENEYDLYSWNRTATDEEWQNNHDGTDLQNGIGFLYANRNDMEMNFTATLLNSGDPITLTAEYDEVEHGGWNLYGNPFPCEAYITTDAEGITFYRLVGNELVPFTGAIAPMEGFFVKATAAGQTFTISREATRE